MDKVNYETKQLNMESFMDILNDDLGSGKGFYGSHWKYWHKLLCPSNSGQQKWTNKNQYTKVMHP